MILSPPTDVQFSGSMVFVNMKYILHVETKGSEMDACLRKIHTVLFVCLKVYLKCFIVILYQWNFLLVILLKFVSVETWLSVTLTAVQNFSVIEYSTVQLSTPLLMRI